MTDFTPDWDRRVADHWRRIDDFAEDAFCATLETLLVELPDGSPTASFERAAVFDSFGHADRAVPLYQTALADGLDGERRRRAVIQMSSSMRNLGDAQRAVDLLTAELALPADHLTGAVHATLALALTDVGRTREAVAVAVTALAAYLPRYNRSMARYAAALMTDGAGH